MARARNIKPGFFINDTLGELEPLTRLLFAGLWCIADRRGRLEDRPKKIKAEILPYDDCDCDTLLQNLCDNGFIIRYSHGENRYIQIQNFDKHQNPHKNESESTIPAPDEYGTSTVQESEKHSTNRADSLNLIPDSLNSDSLIPQDIPPLPPEGEKRPDKSAQRKAEIKTIWQSYSFSEPLGNAIKSWGEYKHEKRQEYKPQGLKSLLTEVQNNAAKYGENAVIALISESMSANYTGITWDKLKRLPDVRGAPISNKPPKGSSYDLEEIDKLLNEGEL